MTTSPSLEDILERQSLKLRDLETATELIKNKTEMKEELLQLRTEASSMSDGVGAMRTWLQKTREQNNRCRELLSSIKLLDGRIIHMENNVPQELIRDYQSKSNISNNSLRNEPVRNLVTSIEANTETPDTPKRDCKKILFSEPEVYPIIPLITSEEFSKIPKYIIGRQTLATVNNLLDSINQILKAKYTFLSLGKAHARKQGDLNLYLHYKKQDLDICTTNEYVYFFTGEDYEKQTNSKLNKIKLNLLVVLRHCKRLREHRVKNDIRYVVQK